MNDTAQRGHFEGAIWDVPLSEWEQRRITSLVEAIPEGVRTILDVGCGDGRITHLLAERGYEITGVDGSPTALARVRVPKKLCDIGAIDFEDDSFDLVLSTEVLEHLPDEVHAQALVEMQRLARRWVLITVPNDEPLELAETRCPNCKRVFHVYGHLRRYRREDMAQLLPNARQVEVHAKNRAPVWHPATHWLRFDALRRYRFAERAVCPGCAHTDFSALRWDPVRAGIDRLNRVLSRGKTRAGGYLLGLFEVGPEA
jgi:SAM-dependent methyltransferase